MQMPKLPIASLKGGRGSNNGSSRGRGRSISSLSGGRGGSTIGLPGGCGDTIQRPSINLGGFSLGLSGGQSGSPRGSLGVQSGPPPRLLASWITPRESVSETHHSPPEVGTSFPPVSPEAPVVEEHVEDEMVDIADDRIFLTCHGKNKMYVFFFLFFRFFNFCFLCIHIYLVYLDLFYIL